MQLSCPLRAAFNGTDFFFLGRTMKEKLWQFRLGCLRGLLSKRHQEKLSSQRGEQQMSSLVKLGLFKSCKFATVA